MNVLIVAQYFPPDLGGAATRAYNIAKGLSLNGCSVTVVTAFPHYPLGKIPAAYRWKPYRMEKDGQLRIIRTFMPPIKSEGFFKRLLLRLTFAFTALIALPLVKKVDAVWASSWISGYVYSKVKRKPLILNVDDLTLEDLADLKLIDESSPFFKIGSLSYRLFYVKADKLTPISNGYFKIIENKYCVTPEKICLVRGGVDLSTFKPIEYKKKHEDKFVVLYSGAFSVAYDFQQIIQAAKLIQSVDPGVDFVIQGAGELLGSMQDTVKNLDVNNVKIINKILSRSQVATLMSSADVLILPLAPFFALGQPYRGMSSKLYEYQAVGKPIICCSKGVPSIYVQETNSGLTVTPGDSEKLAEIVLMLKRNPDLCKKLGRNGRNYVEKYASIQAIGFQLKKLLQ